MMPELRWKTLLLTLALTLFAVPVFADAESTFKKGLMALEEGHPDEAVKLADAGYAEKKLGKFLLLKALGLEKLGKVGQAWEIMQLIVPHDLPEVLRDEFVKAYDRLEVASKQAVVRQAAEAAEAARLAEIAKIGAEAKAATHDRHQKRAKLLWISGAVVGAAGGGLVFYGWTTTNGAAAMNLTNAADHQTYKDQMAQGRTLYWAGVGAAAVGGALLVWAALEQSQANAVAVGPLVAPDAAGFAVAGRF